MVFEHDGREGGVATAWHQVPIGCTDQVAAVISTLICPAYRGVYRVGSVVCTQRGDVEEVIGSVKRTADLLPKELVWRVG